MGKQVWQSDREADRGGCGKDRVTGLSEDTVLE